MTLLGHLIRAENSDPMKCITFLNDGLLPNKPQKLRGGHPRAPWINSVMSDSWNSIRKTNVHYCGNLIQRKRLLETAAERLPPFATKKRN